jgi:histidine triad (HIT) family protein
MAEGRARAHARRAAHARAVPGRLDPADGAAVFRRAQVAAAALRASTLRCEGVNLFLAYGEAAGQEVFHVHLHVIPRHAGDGFGLRFPPGYSVRRRAELDEAAEALEASWPSASA